MGDIVSAARSRAAELGVVEHVIWTGRVDDLEAYYRLADVYVTASLHEGFGVPLIEAMACGVPVVASRAGAMPWVVGEAGRLCQPGAVDELAEAVLALLGDADLRRTLRARGLERARLFGRESYEQGLTEILDEAIADRLPDERTESATGAGYVRSQAGRPASGHQTILDLLVREIRAQSDVALRDYEVRSGVPLLGPLIVWVRRNLTSHLGEPYLDPIIERQVLLNLRVAEWIRHAAQAWAEAEGQQAALQERVDALEAQVESLQQRLDDAPSGDE